MATTKIRSSSILDGQVAIADIVGGGAAAACSAAIRAAFSSACLVTSLCSLSELKQRLS